MANQPKKYKKFVATAATATLVASAIVPVASAASLSDIAGNTHEEAINALVDAKVISGYPDGTFKPNKTLTRSDVVKLLGKYLVAEGYEIPSDAVSNPRFSDLSSKSNKELLEYAAVVADNGVFNGSNGKLLAGDNITRENMAIVLVRMVNTLKDISLEEYVDAQNFKGDVKDLNAAKAEARTAIKVLDFYDITNPSVANFNPKGDTTRGQFATFLHKTINTDFAGAAVTGNVKAINATTVEVTFGEDVKDIKALDFAIEGLEVSNAVIKQSDKKTVVLTTSPQTAGVEYTVTVNGDKVGKFIGISAVIPTAVNIVEKSLQAPVGTQVTLKAQVTVAEGQSKAGIPVTFNIVNNASIGTATLNQPIVAEAKTDENGVATYTYTRYAQTSFQLASNDEVQVYATGNPTKRDFSKVYWADAQPLTLTEITQGGTITNGGKKVYKVKVALHHAEPVLALAADGTYKTTGKYKVNVGFRENIDVTPDKAIKTIDVIDSRGINHGYPGQFTSSTAGSNNLQDWVKEVELEVDGNGEAIFTLSGANATVTPFIFVDQKVNPANNVGSQARFNATELNVGNTPVTFAKQHTLALTNAAQGQKYAASFLEDGTQGYNDEKDSTFRFAADRFEVLLGTNAYTQFKDEDTINTGGRDYKGVLTDKDGKLAPANTPVKLSVEFGSALKANGGAIYVLDNNALTLHRVTADASKPNETSKEYKTVVELLTDTKGAVDYTLVGYKDSYATPTLFIESGDEKGLDKNDLSNVGEIVYFSDAVISSGKVTGPATANSDSEVTYTYQTVDQNGKAYRPSVFSVSRYLVTFEVATSFNTVTVSPVNKDIQFGATGLPTSGANGFVVDGILNNYTSKVTDRLYSKNQTDTELAQTQAEYYLNASSQTVGQDSTGNQYGNYKTFVVLSDLDGKAQIKVKGNGVGTTVTVTATASEPTLTNASSTTTTQFGHRTVANPTTAVVSTISTAALTFNGYAPIAIPSKDVEFYGIGATPIADVGSFVTEVKRGLELGDVTVTYKVENGITKFFIISSPFTGGSTITNLVNTANKAVAAIPTTITVDNKADAQAKVAAAKTAIAAAEKAGATEAQLATAKAAVAKAEAELKALEDADTTKVTVTVTEAVAAGDFIVGTEKLGTIAAAEAGKETVITLVEGKELAKANFDAKIGDKEYTVTYADGKYTVAPKVEAGDDVTVGGIENIDIKEPLVGLVGLTIKLTEAVKSGLEVTEASTLVVTLADGTVVEAAYTAATEGFTFAFKGKTQDAVKAGKVTIK